MWEWAKKLLKRTSIKPQQRITGQNPIPPSLNLYGSSPRVYGSTGGAKWPGGLSASGSINTLDHYTLRQNARNAYHDTPQINAIVERFADNVGYTGLKLECAPRINILGITLEEAEKWSVNVEESFDLWAKSKKQHRSETLTWYQLHRLYQIFQQRDNDIFIRLFYSKDRQLLNPLQWDIIDPNQVRGDAFTSTGGPFNAGFDDGIVRDARGREKAYKLWLFSDNSNSYELVELPAVGTRSGRRMMIHGFTPEYAMQTRGYTRLSKVLQEFQNLTDFSLSHIKNAINQSLIAMFVQPSKDKPAASPFTQNVSERGVGPRIEEESLVSDPAYPYIKYNPINEAAFDTPGSVGVFNLQAGEELKTLQTNAPLQSYDRFVDSFLASLSSSMSMPLEVLQMKFNQNYSASRAALLMFWQVAMIWKNEMEADCLNPVYEMWLSEEIASGRIQAAGWSNPRMKAAWLNCVWIGAPMPNIDPQRTAKADQLYVEMGAQTLDQVARKNNGSDGRANRAKLKEEISELTKPPWSKGNDKSGGKKEEED